MAYNKARWSSGQVIRPERRALLVTRAPLRIRSGVKYLSPPPQLIRFHPRADTERERTGSRAVRSSKVFKSVFPDNASDLRRPRRTGPFGFRVSGRNVRIRSDAVFKRPLFVETESSASSAPRRERSNF